MIKKIYKYKLEITDKQTVALPADADILSVDAQLGELCLWAVVVPNNFTIERRIEIFGTGADIPTGLGISRIYLGTVVMPPFVWHVFERVSNG